MLVALAAAAFASGLEADVRALCGADPIDLGDGPVHLASRNVHHPDTHLAAAWVEQRLRDADLDVWTEPVEVDGSLVVNVVGDRLGADPELPWLVVGAHYDSTASFDEGYDPTVDPAPGADDDASGVAVVLEVARRLRGVRLARSIRFALFTGEEEGLVGSAWHADHLDLPGVELMYSLDPVGYDPGGAGVLWAAYDADAEDLALGLEDIDVGLDVYVVDEALIGGDTRSDQHSFRLAGYPAVHLGSYPQPPTYHTAGDTLEVVDPAYVAAVADLVEAHVRSLAVPLPVATAVDARGCDTTGGLAWAGFAGVVALTRRERRRAPRIGGHGVPREPIAAKVPIR